MKVRNAKKLVITLLSIAVTLLFSCCLVQVVAQNKKSITQQKNINADAVDALEFTNDWLEEVDYNKTSVFEIRDLEQLLNFSKILKLYNFQGKKVNLKSDINLSTTPWNPCGSYRSFAGTFNGECHTITGAGKVISNSTDYINHFNYGVLFYDLYDSACVKNLRLKDFVINNCGWYAGGMGALAGYANGNAQISNISIENLKITISINETDATSSGDYGAIIGRVMPNNSESKVNVKINDCEIVGGEINYEGNGYYATIIGSVGSYSDSIVCEIKNCVVKNFKINGEESSNYVNRFKLENAGLGSTKRTLETNTNQIAKLESITNLACYMDFDSGVCRDSFETMAIDTWFYDSTYNCGYPKLRDFIEKHEKYYFYDEDGYDVDGNTVVFGSVKEIDELSIARGNSRIGMYTYQPKGIRIVYSETNNIIEIGDKIFKAVPINDEYKFTKWVYERDTTSNPKCTIHKYTAIFENNTFQVSFVDATGVKSGDSVISPSESGPFTMIYGHNISVTKSDNEIKYSFTNSFNVPKIVIYTINNEKYEFCDTVSIITVQEKKDIQPTVKVKTFTVTFSDVNYAEKGSSSKISGDDHFVEEGTGSQPNYQIVYGEKITVTQDSKNNTVTFTYKATDNYTYTITYSPKEDKIAYIKTTYKKGNEEDFSDLDKNTTTTIEVKSDLTIAPVFTKWCEVTFIEVENATLDNYLETDDLEKKLYIQNFTIQRFGKRI